MAKAKDYGWLAFPFYEPSDGLHAPQANEGMFLRDYFAAFAMQAELNSSGSFDGPAEALASAAAISGRTIPEQIAYNSYLIADAMLAERSK